MSFRRMLTALAVLALFAGLASAQIVFPTPATPGALACTAASTPNTLRSEGLTEMVGDILITCTGGTPIGASSPIPQATITVTLPGAVTSRLLPIGGTPNASEALLIINEAGNTAIAGALPAQVLCTTPNVGCSTTTTAGGLFPTAGANTFFGVVNGNSVTFIGVPVMPPASAGVATTFRITNVRMNANTVGGNGTPVSASISAGATTAFQPLNPVVTVGTVLTGLFNSATTTTSVRNASNSGGLPSNGLGFPFDQCVSQNKKGLSVLRFAEGFSTAFKTRVVPTAAYPGSGIPNPIGTGYGQSQPGNIYAGTGVPAAYTALGAATNTTPGPITNASESGLILPNVPTTSGGTTTAGLADFGTRLKATFTNIPAGVTIYVTTTNLTGTFTTGDATFSTIPAGTNLTSVFAQLVTGETAAETFGVPAQQGTTTTNSGATSLFALTPVNGTATAVWEILNASPAATETAFFGVYLSYTAAPSATPASPALGTAQIQLSYAPTFDVTATPTAAMASSSLPIPRFAAPGSANNFFVINQCVTNLLFPFVTNQLGFDTGLAISNTTTDPFGTAPQSGTCTLNFYGAAAPTAAVTTPAVPTGTTYTNLASIIAPGFQGYMIAQCNFQLGHGFAFISDLGARNLAMGYLSLVIGGRGTPESLGQ